MGCGVSNEMPLVEEDAINKNRRRSKDSSSSGGFISFISGAFYEPLRQASFIFNFRSSQKSKSCALSLIQYQCNNCPISERTQSHFPIHPSTIQTLPLSHLPTLPLSLPPLTLSPAKDPSWSSSNLFMLTFYQFRLGCWRNWEAFDKWKNERWKIQWSAKI